ncbi:MAG: T9SS type A sorting domain-containing protein [candidate division KSB1 bacterium]|nr:T9SS type A sorting domain-containing protein [candidate division KSB1 bacterium]
MDHSKVQSFGVSFKTLGVNPGDIAVYIDDIYFEKDTTSTGVQTPTEAMTNTPGDYQLFHNFPNPFNPETKIRYDLPQSSRVRIEIYDIVGRHVTTLVDEAQNAGSHQVTFDGQNLASGVYIYTLKAGGTKDVKKMILLK